MPPLLQNMEREKNVEQPKRNFPDLLAAYLAFTKHHEASKRIHLWSFLTILAATVERKVYLNRGYFKLYPNLYTFIVGQSGIIKKSTSTGMAVSLLRAIEDVKIMSDRVTASSLIEQIQASSKIFEMPHEEYEHSSIFIYASELIVFVKEVFGSVTELLTTFWDSPEIWTYKTKHQGTNVVKNVCMNMLAATTIQWLKEGITEQIMSAGFAGRVVFVCERDKPEKWVAWPEPPIGHQETRIKIIEDLHHIHNLYGEIKISSEARDFYTHWYTEHMDSIAKPNSDARMSGYLGRKGEMSLKVAMLRSISLSDDMVVTLDHLRWAIDHLEDLERDLVEIYAGKEKPKELLLKFSILDLIRARGQMKREDIYMHFDSDVQLFQIRNALEELTLTERVLIGDIDGKIGYRFNPNIDQGWR